MRTIDAALLRDLAQGEKALFAPALAPVLARALQAARIESPCETAHFLAQGCYETWYFARLEEDLAYSAARIAQVWPWLRSRARSLAHNPEALANAAYARVDGNGDESSGDGWRFRGRGFFQLTGRNNYVLAGKSEDPDCVAAAEGAVDSAVAFWRARRIGLAALAGNCMRVTRLVNGATEGLEERAALSRRALELLTATNNPVS